MSDQSPENSSTGCCDAPAKATVAQREPGRFVRPRYRIKRHDNGANLRIDVPGSTKSSVNVSVEDGILTVKAGRADTVGKDWRPMLTELDRAGYLLKLELNADFAPDGIRAKVENGVLHLALPFAETAKPRAIAVQ